MKTIWLMLMLMSSPNMPSVKYNALLYNSEDECMNSVVDYLNYYEQNRDNIKDLFYKQFKRGR